MDEKIGNAEHKINECATKQDLKAFEAKISYQILLR